MTNKLFYSPKCTPIPFRSGSIASFFWGTSSNPPILLLHGGLANSHWYAQLGHDLSQHFYVGAFDLPGHGQSTWLDSYDWAVFAEFFQTILACFPTPPILIAHSFSAKLAPYLGITFQNAIKTICLLDPPPMTFSTQGAPGSTFSRRRVRYYPTKSSLTERFKILPPQPFIGPENLLEHVKNHSVIQDAEGFRWAFDPNFWFKLAMHNTPVLTPPPTQPHHLIAGEYSRITTPSVIIDYKKQIPHLKAHVIPGAHHAIMLDTPSVLAELLLKISST